MRLTFEIPVTFLATPTSMKLTRMVFAHVKRVIEIPSASSDEAPVALYANARDRGIFAGLRVYEDRLYTPIGAVSACIPTHRALFSPTTCPPQFASYFARVEKEAQRVSGRAAGTVKPYPKNISEDLHHGRPIKLHDLSNMSFKDLEFHQIEQQVMDFEARLSGFVLVDGRLHRACREPVIAIRAASGDAETFQADVIFLDSPILKGADKADRRPDALFRMDEAQRAVEYCVTAGATNDIAARIAALDVNVMDASALKLDSDRASMFCLARTVAMRMADHQVVKHPRIMELVERYSEEHYPDELGDLVSDLFDSHSDAFPAGIERYMASGVVNMWNNRPISTPYLDASASPRF
ncbi:hypothetical protein OIU34_18935 [Pararhizobium sp. BT-229]|uniref:hypothetical protein n=1 Tax=Pararhizobium sp. BT-229 TaxID=2986923 RepID=UPI0021F79EB5|nr:hypothetical protein [Pararhizobium sp. BT-229]MCV9963957.1 hypothetical protein [Pararhizobium sp. BT-229]